MIVQPTGYLWPLFSCTDICGILAQHNHTGKGNDVYTTPPRVFKNDFLCSSAYSEDLRWRMIYQKLALGLIILV